MKRQGIEMEKAIHEYTRFVDIKRLQFIENSLSGFDPKTSKVLDVGCGNGNISLHLGSLGFDVLGIDVSTKAIDKANAKNNLNNVKFDVKDAEELLSAKEKYDVIICSEVIEHLTDPQTFLKNLYQILKDNGNLIITVPNGYGPREILVTRPMQKISRKNSVAGYFIGKLKRILGYTGKTVQSDAENLTHLQFFSKRYLKRISGSLNYKIINFQHADFIADVFPVSLITRKKKVLQKIDCMIADWLPHYFSSGFHMVWVKDVKSF